MYKRFTMMVASVLLLLLPLNAFANAEVYPIKSQYPDGIEAADISLFSNDKEQKPIETGFEKTSEIELLVNESESDQIGASEASYSGKFALEIKKRDDKIIPVYETEYFQTGYGSADWIDEENSNETNSNVAYNSKCNFYSLMLKPMSNSETLSFYVKVKKLDELGNIEEVYALLKSDSDGDGIYSVGTDLSRGKWQTVQLNIADLDEEFKNGSVSGLYMNANKGSQWLIDDISSDYQKINKIEFNLTEFASDNVIYTDEGLRFANNNESKDYNIGAKVVSGKINVNDPLSGIKIDSRLQFASDTNSQQKEIKETLTSISLENDNCIANNEEEILCEKVPTTKERDELPKVPISTTMNISFNSETEKRIRLLLSNRGSNNRSVTIKTENGDSKTYTLTKPIYTDWFDSGITITSANKLSGFMVIHAIEYESIEENPQKDVLIDQGGSFIVNLGGLVTDNRVTLAYELSYENAGNSASELLLELFEGDLSEPYYSTKTYINRTDGKKAFENILPKIKANTKLKVTNTITKNTPVTIRVSKMELLKLSDSDWNKTIDYVDYEMTEKKFSHTENSTYIKSRLAKNIYSEEEKYAVVYPDASGVVNTGTGNVAAGGISSNISVYRILNLSEEPVKILITSSSGSNITSGTPIYLHYGLADYVFSTKGKYLALPPNEKVMLISKTSYSDEKSDASPIYYTFVDGLEDGSFVQNATSIIYPNLYDSDSTYKYNLETKTCQKLTSDKFICSSPDGTHLLLKDSNEKYYILNTLTNEKEETPLTGSYRECFFNVKNELFVVNKSLSYYSSGELHTLISSVPNNAYISYDFDSTGEYLLWTQDKSVKLYKNTNNIWNVVKSFSIDYKPKKSVLSNDISTAYIQVGSNNIYAVDLNTQTASNLFSGNIFEVTDDNMLLYSNDGYHYLYNLVTAEKQKLFNYKFECNSISYNPETNMVTGIMPNSRVIYQRFTAEEPEAKYALSFDGGDNWYAYAGGRWQTVSKSTIPTSEELRLTGMTASVVNSIPSSAYEKLYGNNADVLSVDVAIYMYSDSQKRTPVVENIVVETIEKDNTGGLYGTHIERYNKEDYREITSLFPIENFGSNAECYYLFYIGNEWLYTYKDNEIVKVNESANILLSDMSETWIKFKQYGMDAKELRRVPGDVLSQLFVNADYANTEFGVIYVIKTQNEDASEYTVNFRLSASSDFITNDDIVLELIMNGGDVKIIKSTEFSVTDIENLLSWIEARQNGNGEIFYRLSNANTQHFINYYMINSVSVYDGEEYRTKN